jgi:predicted dehydrogenase
MVRLAIIGLGAATRNIHLPAYASLRPKVEIVGACDNDSDTRDHFKKTIGTDRLFSDPAEMIKSTCPDVVSICTPPSMHLSQSILALESGCHVFLEKPMAESLRDADEIITSARQNGKVIVVNNQFPAMKIFTSAKEQIGQPQFGRLLFLHAQQTFRPTETTEAGWRGQLRRRLCFEFGIHVFELIRFFFDAMPIRMIAHMPSPFHSSRADTINVITMEFEDGRAASVLLNRVSKGPERYLDIRLDGEHASILASIGGQARLEMGLKPKTKRPFIDLGFAKGGTAFLQNGDRSVRIGREGANPFAAATAAHFTRFIDAIKAGKTPPASAADNRNTLALVLAAYESAGSGSAVELKDFLDTSAACEPGFSSYQAAIG